MQASGEQVRGVAIDVVEGVRNKASDLVVASADQVVTGIDRGVSGLEAGIGRAAEALPVVEVEVPGRRSRRPVVLLVAAVVGVVVAAVILRRARRAGDREPVGSHDHGDLRRYEVVPADVGWELRDADADEVIDRHRTQADALDRGVEMAREGGGGDVVIHGLDGSVRDTRHVH